MPKKVNLELSDFINIDEIQEEIKNWVKVRENARTLLIGSVGFISGWLLASGDILFSVIIIAAALYMSVTEMGETFTNSLITKIQELFNENPEKKLDEAKMELRKATAKGK